jgi:transposase
VDRSKRACARRCGLTRRLARELARVAVGMGPAVEPQLREAPVMSEGSWVGLDVHARSVFAVVIDATTGEVRSLRLPPGGEATVAWLQTLPAPVGVVFEAGPTGYRLARACADAGINCLVAAPSRVRAAADRVKTERRDAERLARLLRLGEITPVRILRWRRRGRVISFVRAKTRVAI